MITAQGFIRVNGARLYYEQAGVGPSVVFVHGNTLDTRMWDDQFEVFAERYHVVRYDCRGFGQSSLPRLGEPYSLAADLKALLDGLGVARAHVVGLSMGGRVAIDFAIRYPQATASLVAVDAGLDGFQRAPDVVKLRQAIVDTARAKGAAAALELWLADPLFQPAARQPAVAARLQQIVGGYSGWHWLNNDPQEGLTPPANQRLSEIKAPTLAIVGEQDLPDFHKIAALLTKQAANARAVNLPGVGHMSNMEAPAEFNRVALEFLVSVAGD